MRRAGFGVAVFDDDGGLQGEAPLVAAGWETAREPGTTTALRNDERLIVLGGIDGIAHQIVHGNRAVEHRAGASTARRFTMVPS